MIPSNEAIALTPRAVPGPFESPRIAVRFPLVDPSVVDLGALVAVLGDRVANADGDEALVDVVSYAHVPRGPGLLLVGADVHYAVTDGPAASVARIQRRPWALSPRQRLLEAVDRTRALAEHISADPRSPAGFALRTDELEIGIHDRLHAPPNPETFARAAPFVEAVLSERYASVVVTPAGVDGGPFTVRVVIRA
ncbi:MAG: hypothetical protein RMA76_04875 [Deltaproteobacteria bacterium]|jgi:hypothetical protein